MRLCKSSTEGVPCARAYFQCGGYVKQSHSCTHCATLPSLAADRVKAGLTPAGMGCVSAELPTKAVTRVRPGKVPDSRIWGMSSNHTCAGTLPHCRPWQLTMSGTCNCILACSVRLRRSGTAQLSRRGMATCISPEWPLCEAVTLMHTLCRTAKLGS